MRLLRWSSQALSVGPQWVSIGCVTGLDKSAAWRQVYVRSAIIATTIVAALLKIVVAL